MLDEALLMNRNLTIWVGVAMLMVTACVCSADEVFPVVHHEPIAVRVVDGKGGRPQARVRVLLTAGYDRRDLALGLWREEAVTDAEGQVRLSDALRNLPLLRMEVLKRHVCSAGTKAAISVERIRLSGLSGANRCGFAFAENVPGVFTVFVKGKGASPQSASLQSASPQIASVRSAEAPTKPVAPETGPQAKSEALIIEPDPPAPLTDNEVAEMLLEQN
jgi:hypothetical protein